eukprot:1373228-Rhodomonas_salina.1
MSPRARSKSPAPPRTKSSGVDAAAKTPREGRRGRREGVEGGKEGGKDGEKDGGKEPGQKAGQGKKGFAAADWEERWREL